MRFQQCSLLLLAGLAFAQVPSGRKPNNPPEIPDWVSIEKNIPYGRYPETVLDVLQPKTKQKGKRPGVLLIHGGGWTGGTKEQRVEYAALQWLWKGFVVANVEYRLAKAAPAPAAVSDVLEAARWFRGHAGKYKVDPNRIVATGDSAGGHLALMVAMTPKTAELGTPAKVAAVVDFYGIADVNDQIGGPNQRAYAVTWVPEQPGRETLARRVSPMTYIRRDLPPILAIHGDSDKTVPYEHSAKLVQALQAAGAGAKLLSVPGHGHSMPQATLDAQYGQIFAWLRERGVLR
ncbi:MAG: alpha/beta hydrolase [Acidobacteria bacterium]|nr:alpha/beta hydrolase [Acidobacteriota bacterium]